MKLDPNLERQLKIAERERIALDRKLAEEKLCAEVIK